MARKATGWTCQRVAKGVKCGFHNPPGTRKCAKCLKARPKKKRPAHMAALDLPYEHYLALNNGVERCAICGKEPTPGRRLQRDHDHNGDGVARGLLCFNCNKALAYWMTPEWLENAARYLRR